MNGNFHSFYSFSILMRDRHWTTPGAQALIFQSSPTPTARDTLRRFPPWSSSSSGPPSQFSSSSRCSLSATPWNGESPWRLSCNRTGRRSRSRTFRSISSHQVFPLSTIQCTVVSQLVNSQWERSQPVTSVLCVMQWLVFQFVKENSSADSSALF